MESGWMPSVVEAIKNVLHKNNVYDGILFNHKEQNLVSGKVDGAGDHSVKLNKHAGFDRMMRDIVGLWWGRGLGRGNE